MSTTAQHQQPTPEHFFNAVNAYEQTEAMKAALELEIFTAIAEGNITAATIAKRCEASERGVRTLCDFLSIHSFLTKEEAQYALAPDSALFLDRRSPAYVGAAIEFLLTPRLRECHARLAEAVRQGGSVVPNPDRVTPPTAAAFSLMMLVATPSGDAYTFAELESILNSAGFARVELAPREIGLDRLVISVPVNCRLRGLHVTRLPFHEDTGEGTRAFVPHSAASWIVPGSRANRNLERGRPRARPSRANRSGSSFSTHLTGLCSPRSPCIRSSALSRTFFKLFCTPRPSRAGSGVKGAPRSGAFIEDP